MRNAAALTEKYANTVRNAHFSVGSPAAHGTKLIHDHILNAFNAIVSCAPDETAPKGRKRKAGAVEDGDEKPTKRKREPKDPNAPKRPPSSYIMFQNEIRKELKEQHPNITNSELLVKIGKLWGELSTEDKSVSRVFLASVLESDP